MFMFMVPNMDSNAQHERDGNRRDFLGTRLSSDVTNMDESEWSTFYVISPKCDHGLTGGRKQIVTSCICCSIFGFGSYKTLHNYLI